MSKTKPWNERIDWTVRKSKLAVKICQWFKENKNDDLTFGEILDKYFDGPFGPMLGTWLVPWREHGLIHGMLLIMLIDKNLH